MDIEESGKQIGEKLFLLLNEEQKNALMQYILEQGVCHGTVFNSCHTFSASKKNPLTEIQEGELYLCLEHRTVRVRERIINLTSKELLAPGAHSQFGSGKNTQFEPEQRANPFENVFSKTAVFPPPAIAETDL